MKKLFLIIISLISLYIPFTEAKENWTVEHIWNDISLTYDWESITLYDETLDWATQKCPIWYHIWSAEEWSKLIKLWYNIQWYKYQYMELSTKTYNQIEEEFYNWDAIGDEIGASQFYKDLNFWAGIKVSYKTSTIGPKHEPYVFYSTLTELVPNIVGRSSRYSFIGIKTCWNVNIIADPCNNIKRIRCFKDDKNITTNNWFSKEYNDAYIFAYNNKITSMPTIEKANMYWEIKRMEIAKMLSNRVKIFWFYQDPNTPCNFTDTSSVKWDLATAIIESCRYWIMWQWITKFRPYDNITRWEVATAISRILWWAMYDWWKPYYVNHINALKNAWVLSNTSNPKMNELRWNVMVMIMKANDILKNDSINCNDTIYVLACTNGSNECPEKCRKN
jgi:hypothetical protein